MSGLENHTEHNQQELLTIHSHPVEDLQLGVELSTETEDGEGRDQAMTDNSHTEKVDQTQLPTRDGLSQEEFQIQTEESRDDFVEPAGDMTTFLKQSGSPPKRQNSWALRDSEAVLSQESAQLYTWGRGDFGQLCSGDTADAAAPVLVKALELRNILQADGNLYNTALLTGDGELLMSGNNDNGQLGMKSEATLLSLKRVTPLDAFTVHHIAVGLGHCVAVVGDGMLAVWGSNDYGQLGLGTEGPDLRIPKLLRRTSGQANVRVAAGESHTLALTSAGQVHSFGKNMFGQLGHGTEVNCSKPTEVSALWPLGVVQVACGENHSAAVTAKGELFTWGRGKYGQLGLGTFENSLLPQRVQSTSTFTQVACGGDHTLALSNDGKIFSWGRGSWGQTGHGHADNLCNPHLLEALQHLEIVQVAAGARASLALSKDGAVFAFGSGEMGQLGLGDLENRLTPAQLPSLGELPLLLMAAGDHALAVCRLEPSGSRLPAGQQAGSFSGKRCALSLPSLADLAAAAKEDRHSLMVLKQALEDMFGSPGYLVAQVAAVAGSELQSHGLDMTKVSSMYTSILRVYDAELVGALAAASSRLAERLESCSRASTSGQGICLADETLVMQTCFILLQNPLNSESVGKQIMQKLVRAIAQSKGKQKLMTWLAELPPEIFAARNIRPLQKYLSSLAVRQYTLGDRGDLVDALHLLLLMYNTNQKAGLRVPASEFYNLEISENLPLDYEYMTWVDLEDKKWSSKGENRGGTTLVSACQTPFVLTPMAKAKILQHEAFMQKHVSYHQASYQALRQGFNPAAFRWLDIRVRREHLLEDALAQIVSRPSTDLKKPLRVTFLSGGAPEEGLDQGGVTKEFFQLLSRAIFNEAYGMFVLDQQTRNFWFNFKAMEAEGEFRLVGSLLGLAVYSSVILDVHFPIAIYKKLLRQPLGFEDLKQAFPELGKGLQSLLDFQGDVEGTFCRTFEVEYDYFGEMRTHPLKPGGADIPVTAENRKEFVELYTKWILHDSIRLQFAAFAHGFHEVCGGPALTLFRSEELELLVAGLPHLNFEDLQSVARYDGGYNQEHPTIRSFWSIIQSFSLQEKKLFLKFTTGCDRAPVGGLGNLELVIQRSGPDTESLPTSHTCFNYLLLPEYSTEAKLRKKLVLAINNAEGFGLQ